MKKLTALAVLAALAVLGCSNPSGGGGGDGGTFNYTVTSLAEALAKITNPVSGDVYNFELAPGVETMAAAQWDVPGGGYLSWTGLPAVSITIDGKGRTVTLSDDGSLLDIGTNVSLVLKDITLKGRGIEMSDPSNSQALVHVDGSLEIQNGVTITGNKRNGNGGSGMSVGGTFIMNGGSIEYNSSSDDSGVSVHGTFIMNEGSIKNNTADGPSGGVDVVWDGTVIMNGGSIENNTATNGGGVYVDRYGTFTMNGGFIENNTADSLGGGVYIDGGITDGGGAFDMSGGTISGNTANNGGGVYVFNDGIFTMSGGFIENNTAEGGGGGGGGVYVDDGGTFTMSGDAAISGNTTAGGEGGGVYADDSAVISKTGGTIYGNDASPQALENKVTGYTDRGAAVYVYFFDGGVHLEKTVGSGKNLSKENTDTTAADLTAIKGWTEY